MGSLHVRGYSLRAIAELLAKEGLVNPHTGKPWSYETIRHDIELITAYWQEQVQRNYAAHQADLLEGLDEVQRAAWRRGDYGEVRRCVMSKAELLGVKGPQRVDVTTSGQSIVALLPPLEDDDGD
ncbi:MAG: hypothetical protein ACP5G7_11935 [Anaerolineae bacterium]